RQLQVERVPLSTLPPSVRETWARCGLRGFADVVGKLHFDGRQWLPNLKIDCHDLSLCFDRFAYRLTDGSGTVVLKPDYLSLRLKTSGGGRVIACRAEIQQPGPKFTGWVELESEGAIPIDDKLLAAMDPATRNVVWSFRPRGSASFFGRCEREAGDAP